MFRASELAKACHAYACEHGDPPAKLSDLAPDFVDADSLSLRFFDSKTTQGADWIYFPPERIEAYQRREPMIASPGTGSSRRILVFTDLSAQILSARDFEEELTSNVNR